MYTTGESATVSHSTPSVLRPLLSVSRRKRPHVRRYTHSGHALRRGVRRSRHRSRKVCVPVPIETAALLESAGVAVHAVQRSGHNVAGRSVPVNGCGPVVPRDHSAGRRHERAGHRRRTQPVPLSNNRNVGAHVAASSAEITDVTDATRRARGGFDAGFDVSGAPGGLPPMLDTLRREATAVVIGHPADPVPVDVARHVNKRGAYLRGAPAGHREDLMPLSNQAGSNRIDSSRTDFRRTASTRR